MSTTKREFEQIKINVPRNEKEVIAYCRRLSGARLLSKTFIRLMKADSKNRKDS
ncbi:MAG: hypothetical protein NC132_01455 [Corallococcus sp.]|nr:hypothetical protein [Corallococcus sp.]MCM1359324.1 hypothetical protein [Corallococcus sp.]MCM1394767.1 hypothetical protein [Corallococcus sp.]